LPTPLLECDAHYLAWCPGRQGQAAQASRAVQPAPCGRWWSALGSPCTTTTDAEGDGARASKLAMFSSTLPVW